MQLNQQPTNKQRKQWGMVGSETDLLQTTRPLQSCSSHPNSAAFDSASLIATPPSLTATGLLLITLPPPQSRGGAEKKNLGEKWWKENGGRAKKKKNTFRGCNNMNTWHFRVPRIIRVSKSSAFLSNESPQSPGSRGTLFNPVHHLGGRRR